MNGLYSDIARRTQGNIYIGVVGPVRTGKSTFIRRFMEALVIPAIGDVYRRERARDELPQSGGGKTVMTAEPKFVPEEAVKVSLGGGGEFSVRLIDSVGYMVAGAVGGEEDGEERMVTTPWFEHEIPMSQAAEQGTRRVIREHSTIGIVVTTDGSIGELPRGAYVPAEEAVVAELKEIGTPFLILLNCVSPESAEAARLARELSAKYGVTVRPANCLTLDAAGVESVIRDVLYEFPLDEVDIFLPPWFSALPAGHEIKTEMYKYALEASKGLSRTRDALKAAEALGASAGKTEVRSLDLGSGTAALEVELPRERFFEAISSMSGFEVKDDGDLVSLLSGLKPVKSRYERFAAALEQVNATGCGVMLPSREELTLSEPEVIRQAGRCGVRLRASGPAVIMLSAELKSEVAPIVGGQQQSEELVSRLVASSAGGGVWEANIFGKTMLELVSEELAAKVARTPPEVKEKFRLTLQRIINDGSGNLICIIL